MSWGAIRGCGGTGGWGKKGGGGVGWCIEKVGVCGCGCGLTGGVLLLTGCGIFWRKAHWCGICQREDLGAGHWVDLGLIVIL